MGGERLLQHRRMRLGRNPDDHQLRSQFCQRRIVSGISPTPVDAAEQPRLIHVNATQQVEPRVLRKRPGMGVDELFCVQLQVIAHADLTQPTRSTPLVTYPLRATDRLISTKSGHFLSNDHFATAKIGVYITKLLDDPFQQLVV